jgi:hypothetical protein
VSDVRLLICTISVPDRLLSGSSQPVEHPGGGYASDALGSSSSFSKGSHWNQLSSADDEKLKPYVFTVQVNGDGAKFLGTGNLHDDNDFDGLVQTSSFSELADVELFTFSDAASPLNQAFCPYTLYVYPSDDLHAEYITSDPAFYAVGTVCAFLFIILVRLYRLCRATPIVVVI